MRKFIFKILPAASALALSLAAFPARAGQNPFIGEIETFAFTFCPTGWAPLNGQLMSIAQNTALFALIGTNYGGDGRSTFALPLARPLYTLTGQPFIQCIALQGIFPSRN